MQQWKNIVLIVAVGAVSLIPVAMVAPLWRRLRHLTLSPWRRTLSTVGLGLATLVSFLPPLWLLTMTLLGEREESSRVVGVAFDAVIAGPVLAILACILLCFAKDRIRWLGLGSSLLTVALFTFWLSAFISGLAGL